MNIHAPGEAVRRREEILRIVRESSVASQEELLKLLRKCGFRVTQPTLSRDVRELGLAKTPSGYVVPEEISPLPAPVAFIPRDRREAKLDHLIASSVLSAHAAGNLVVIRTPVAAAQPVASALDGAQLDGVLGTIGGDDTIFVACATPADAAALARHVHQIAGLSPERPRRQTRV
jgi:transcriptional regulator of arginine metabolism